MTTNLVKVVVPVVRTQPDGTQKIVGDVRTYTRQEIVARGCQDLPADSRILVLMTRESLLLFVSEAEADRVDAALAGGAPVLMVDGPTLEEMCRG
jgi:hypothetical protein